MHSDIRQQQPTRRQRKRRRDNKNKEKNEEKEEGTWSQRDFGYNEKKISYNVWAAIYKYVEYDIDIAKQRAAHTGYVLWGIYSRLVHTWNQPRTGKKTAIQKYIISFSLHIIVAVFA